MSAGAEKAPVIRPGSSHKHREMARGITADIPSRVTKDHRPFIESVVSRALDEAYRNGMRRAAEIVASIDPNAEDPSAAVLSVADHSPGAGNMIAEECARMAERRASQSKTIDGQRVGLAIADRIRARFKGDAG